MAFDRIKSPPNRDRAMAMAQKYVWWKPPAETLAEPVLLAAQMMTMGTLEDVQWMLSCTSSDELRGVLRDPPVGVFNGRSWTYWQRRLNGDPIPPLPVRRVAGLRLLEDAETLQRSEDTLTVSVPTQAGDRVKLSFFGGIDVGRVGRPDQTDDGVAWVASLPDLLAMKLAVLVQRISARDYVDIAAILQTGVPLADGLGAAATLYGREFPPLDVVKALGYFDEGDAANVDAATRDVLRHHTGSWDGSVSSIAKASDSLRG